MKQLHLIQFSGALLTTEAHNQILYHVVHVHARMHSMHLATGRISSLLLN